MRALIAVLPGDGVGPEVTAQAVRVLAEVGRLHGHDFAAFQAAGSGVQGTERIVSASLRFLRPGA